MIWAALLQIAVVRATVPAPCATLLGDAAASAGALIDALEHGRADAEREIDDLGAAVDELVATGKIDRERAEWLFGERVLGRFSPIFLRFALAELSARGFDEARRADFVLHFDHVYQPDAQVDFATDVTKRMVFTINDRPSAANSDDLAAFTAAARGFDVTAELYGEFLRTWAVVRFARAGTVVRFILTNLRRASADARAAIELESAREAEREARDRRRNRGPSWWPQDPVDPARSTDEIAREVIGRLTVPDEIVRPRCLRAGPIPPTTLIDRLVASAAPPGATVLDRIAAGPPFARDHLVATELAHAGYPELEQLIASPVFPTLAPTTRAATTERVAQFRALERLARELAAHLARREHLVHLNDPFEHARSGPKAEQLIETFALDLHFARTSEADLVGRVGAQVHQNFVRLRRHVPGLTAADFVYVARHLVARTFRRGDGDLARAVMQSLLLHSREFVLTGEEVGAVLDAARAFPLREREYEGERPLDQFDRAEILFEPGNWGALAERRDPYRLPDEGWARLSALLPATELDGVDDRRVIQRLVRWARGRGGAIPEAEPPP